MLRFCIVAEASNYYKVIHYFDSHDYRGIRRNIIKSMFDRWRIDKINETDYSKIETIKPKKTKQKQVMTSKQKEIMDIIVEMMDKTNYLMEKDVIVKGYSKKLVNNTLKDTKILGIYGLQRTRTNNKLKEKLGIKNVGNPGILIKNI